MSILKHFKKDISTLIRTMLIVVGCVLHLMDSDVI